MHRLDPGAIYDGRRSVRGYGGPDALSGSTSGAWPRLPA